MNMEIKFSHVNVLSDRIKFILFRSNRKFYSEDEATNFNVNNANNDFVSSEYKPKLSRTRKLMEQIEF